MGAINGLRGHRLNTPEERGHRFHTPSSRGGHRFIDSKGWPMGRGHHRYQGVFDRGRIIETKGWSTGGS